jgi:uncharacterized protein (DUF1501 family)
MTDSDHGHETAGTDEVCSCSEYSAATSSRRSFMRTALAVTGGTVASSVFGDTFRQAAYGQLAGGNVLVVLSLRGGADGMSLVVPHGDPHYAAQRPHIKIPTRSLLFKDAMFGLHPNFAPLSSLWRHGKLGVVHAAGLPQPNRSHFSAIEEIEDADLGSHARVGWINRLVGLDSQRDALQAVSVGSGVMPTSLYGGQPTIAIAKVDDVTLSGARGSASTRRARRQALSQIWRNSPSPLARGARASLSATATLGGTLAHAYHPANGAVYPAGGLAAALEDTARLIKARVGVEVVTLDYGTWDMHSRLGTVDVGGAESMRGMVSTMSHSLAAFFKDLGSVGSRVTLVTLTEFGRRLRENGSGGLDHGWANATLVMGGGVRGGRYHGTWPGLGDAALNDGDLAVTTDYRSILTEIMLKRFNVTSGRVFPDFKPRRVGVMR